MPQETNQLVAAAKRIAVPAAVVGAFALGAALFVGHGGVHAASAIDENSVAALTSLDQAMEAVAARVTPAVVNIAVQAQPSLVFNTPAPAKIGPGGASILSWSAGSSSLAR